MSRSVPRRPTAGRAAKVQPSLQQQLASGKKVKAARQAQRAQGRRKVPDAVLSVPEAASVGASVAGASHISASRLLALLKPPAAAEGHTQHAGGAAVQMGAAFDERDVYPTAPSSDYASFNTAASAAPTAIAVSALIDNRRRQMGSSIFDTDTAPLPLPLARTSHSFHPTQPHYTHHAPPSPLIVPPTASAQPAQAQSVMTSPTGRQSWGGGGRSLEAGDGARDADRQKKLEMRASLDAQMREKEERKRQERLQSDRVQAHWLDAPSAPHASHIQPPSTASSYPTAFSQSATHQPSTASNGTAQPYSVEVTPSHEPSQPSAQSSVDFSSIRSHNQSSSVFATGADTSEQRRARGRQEVQTALRQQVEEKRQREEERKRREAEEERRWEEKLGRERRELASRYANGGLVIVEERKEALEVVQEEKQQLTVREDRTEKAVKRRTKSGSESDSDEEDERRRRRRARDRSRERGRRSKRRHSDSDDSASSSDASDHHSRHRRSSRHRSRRRERRSRYSSQSEEDECIYVTDSAYTHRVRYEQEQKETDSTVSASTSRRHAPKPGSASSSRSSSTAASAPSAAQAKPPFGVRSLQSRARPKPPAGRVRAPPPPLPAGDTKASKQALKAARLAMGRTSGGGERFVTQKWKEQKRSAPQEDRKQQQKQADGSRQERQTERAAVHSVVDEVVTGVQELNIADRLDSTSEWLLPHSLGLPSFRG